MKPSGPSPRCSAALLAAILGCTAALAGACPAPGGTDGPGQEPAQAEELVARGRALLAAGEPAEAQALLERAAALDGGSFRTRVWLLRAWMDQGRGNDTLDAVDELRDAGHAGPALDYLYGMAFVRRAEKHIADGVRDESIRVNLEEAVPLLRRATEADPEEYGDAFLALAKSAWTARDLELARSSIERAVQRSPEDPEARLVLGRIAATQLQAAVDAAGGGPLDEDGPAGPHWRAARAAFEEALRLCGRPVDDPRRRTQLLQAAMELGRLLAWRGLRDEAAEAFARAMAFAPEAVDYRLVRDMLALDGGQGSLEVFHRALAQGAQGFLEGSGPDDARDATLLWWLGTTEQGLGDSSAAIRDLRRAIEKAPGIVNAWHYLGLALCAEGRLDEAVGAFVRGWRLEPAAMLREMRVDPARHVPQLERLIEVARQTEPEDAVVLAEMCAEAEPREPRHWSNLGLLLRFESDRRRAREDADEAPWRELAALSLAAYRRALELAPEDPQLLNDGAVLLQHYLGQDLETAAGMYRRAVAAAEKRLADPSLSAAERERFGAALRDARANLAELEPLLERPGDAREPPAAGAEDGGRGD